MWPGLTGIIVCAEFGYRPDEKWGYTHDGSAVLYLKDVHVIISRNCQLLKELVQMFPGCKWIVVGGSPCQDLTFAGPLRGVLGLIGPSSRLFFVLLCNFCHAEARWACCCQVLGWKCRLDATDTPWCFLQASWPPPWPARSIHLGPLGLWLSNHSKATKKATTFLLQFFHMVCYGPLGRYINHMPLFGTTPSGMEGSILEKHVNWVQAKSRISAGSRLSFPPSWDHGTSYYSDGLEDRILVKKNGLAPRFEHPQIEYSRGKKPKKKIHR